MSKKRMMTAASALVISIVILAFFPPVRERLEWRIRELRVRLHYALNPPEEAIFIPATPLPDVRTSTRTLTTTSTAPPVATAMHTPTPTLTPTPLPDTALIEGTRYEHQHGLWNYCGPSNLSMMLNYWGWEGDRETVGEYLKPEELDKNVSPEEMVDYVNKETELQAVLRAGGTLEVVQRLLANGYPVLIEKGVYFFEALTGRTGWMGHYNVIIGYDDASQEFIIHDTFLEDGENHRFPYEEILQQWRTFNYAFIVIYPEDVWESTAAVLGDYADEKTSHEIAMQTAQLEMESLTENDKYFAWFNLGTNQVYLQNYAGAAETYDAVFAFYPTLPEEGRPWRMMWYQFGPYIAYYNMERYQDVIDLATQTLNTASDPYLEESMFWRFKAERELETD